MGVAIKDRNLPGIPQCDRWDFFRWSLIIFDTSIGDVLILFTTGTPCCFGRKVTSSSEFWTVDFEAKCWFRILDLFWDSFTILPFSSRGGIAENFLLFKSFVRIDIKFSA